MNQENKPPFWEHFEHGADIGIRGFGQTVEQAFEQCAMALTSVISNMDSIGVKECLTLKCNANNLDFLLIDWLNEIIYLMATRKMLFKSFEVHINNCHLNASACGEPVNIGRHKPAVEIKGATFTELKVQKNNHGWIAQCIVDV